MKKYTQTCKILKCTNNKADKPDTNVNQASLQLHPAFLEFYPVFLEFHPAFFQQNTYIILH